MLAEHELGQAEEREEADRRSLRHTGGGIRAVGAPAEVAGGKGVHTAVQKEIEALLAGGCTTLRYDSILYVSIPISNQCVAEAD